MSKLTILYGELNEQVLAAQAELLQKAGYKVQTAVGRKGVQEMLKAGSFDLVIIGPTLTRDDRHHLPYMVKKAQSAKVLEGRFFYTRDYEPGLANATTPETIIQQSGSTVISFGRNSYSPRSANIDTYQPTAIMSIIAGGMAFDVLRAASNETWLLPSIEAANDKNP